MAINTKAIKARISSVKNTKKISKAMQMIAAVKMRKAVIAASNSRTYALLANDLLENLSTTKIKHTLTNVRDVNKVLLIMITSNKGLCGNYNSFVLKEAQKFVEYNKSKGREISVIAIGNKSAAFARRNGLNLEGVYEDLNEGSSVKDIFPISKYAINSFTAGDFDRVTIIFTNYVSGLVQNVVNKQLLPITKEVLEDITNEESKVEIQQKSVKKVVLEKNGGEESDEELVEVDDGSSMFDSFDKILDKDELSEDFFDEDEEEEYIFEPNKTQLLNTVLPMLIEVQIYQAVLESSASEHSSRMIAMKNATDSASDMIETLTLEFNKGRQAAITQEVAEINAGADALS